MEESEDRRLRLKAIRKEANEAEASLNNNTSTAPAHLSNPLAEFANLPVQESPVSARFNFYTDPVAAFSGNRRKSQKTYENTPNNISSHLSSASPGSWNLGRTPSPSQQYNQSQSHSPNQGMYGTPSPHHTCGRRNLSMAPSPNHQYNQSQSHSSAPNQGMYGTPSPHHTSGPWNLSMAPSPNHQYNQSQSHSSDQGIYGTPLSHHSSGSWRSQDEMVSQSPQQLGTPAFSGTPGYGSPSNPPMGGGYPPRSPMVGGYPPNSNSRGGFRPSPSSGRGIGYHFNNSPNSGSGWGGGSPSSNSGRGSGHQFRGRNPGHGRGRGSRGNVSARERPDLFFHRSMLEDPWRYLQPVVIKVAVDSWLPKSIRNKNKAVEAVTPARHGKDFASILAASFEEAVVAASIETGTTNDVEIGTPQQQP